MSGRGVSLLMRPSIIRHRRCNTATDRATGIASRFADVLNQGCANHESDCCRHILKNTLRCPSISPENWANGAFSVAATTLCNSLPIDSTVLACFEITPKDPIVFSGLWLRLVNCLPFYFISLSHLFVADFIVLSTVVCHWL